MIQLLKRLAGISTDKDPELQILEACAGLPPMIDDDRFVDRGDLLELAQKSLVSCDVIPSDVGPAVMNPRLTIAGKRRIKELQDIEFSKSFMARAFLLVSHGATFLTGVLASKVLEWLFPK